MTYINNSLVRASLFVPSLNGQFEIAIEEFDVWGEVGAYDASVLLYDEGHGCDGELVVGVHMVGGANDVILGDGEHLQISVHRLDASHARVKLCIYQNTYITKDWVKIWEVNQKMM